MKTSKIKLNYFFYFFSTGIILLILICIPNQAQVNTYDWRNTYQGEGGLNPIRNNESYGIAIDGQGNAFIAGVSDPYSSEQGGNRIATIRCHLDGTNQDWLYRYWVNGYDDEYCAHDIAYYSSGGNNYVYITGVAFNPQTEQPNFIVMKLQDRTSSAGYNWAKFYDSPNVLNWGSDGGWKIVVDAYGNAYATGSVINTNELRTDRDILTIKFDKDGIQQWANTYDGGYGNDIGHSLVVDNSGNVYVTGESYGNGTTDMVTLKYNSSGIQPQQWDPPPRITNGVGYDITIYPSATPVYVTGKTTVSGQERMTTIRYNSDGSQFWVRNELPGIGYSIVTYDRSVYYHLRLPVTGSDLFVTGKSGNNGKTIHYDINGVQYWAAEYSSANGACSFVSIGVDKYANLYVAGEGPDPNISGYTNCLTVKYDNSGTLQWYASEKYSDYPFCQAKKIKVDASGYSYVSAHPYRFGTTTEFVTFRYRPIVGTGPTTFEHQNNNNSTFNNEIPKQYYLSQNFPNPFNPSTIINYSIPKSGFVKLSIYNVLGQLMKTIVNENEEAGYHTVRFEAANLSSGIYFYRMDSGDYREIKKMTICK